MYDSPKHKVTSEKYNILPKKLVEQVPQSKVGIVIEFHFYFCFYSSSRYFLLLFQDQCPIAMSLLHWGGGRRKGVSVLQRIDIKVRVLYN